MIDAYALLALPLAVFFQRILEHSKPWLRRLSLAGVVVLVLLNLAQTQLYCARYLHHDSMTREAYLHVWRTWDFPPASLLDAPDYQAALEGQSARY